MKILKQVQHDCYHRKIAAADASQRQRGMDWILDPAFSRSGMTGRKERVIKGRKGLEGMIRG